MKKKYLILSLLGSVAFASAVGVAAVSSLNNKNVIKEELADDTFLEDTTSCDDVFSNGLASVPALEKVSYKQGAVEDDLYAPKLGVQFAAGTKANTVSIRYTAAITSLNVKAVWERTVFDQEGNIVKGTKNVEVDKAYSSLKNGGETLAATEVTASDNSKPYKYFVVYVLKNIPLDSNGNALYKLDCKLTLSQDENKVSTPTGTVNAKEGSSISECEINVSLDTNYSYKGSGTAAGNGQYINGKLKTIYASTDTTLNTDYLSLNVSKTVGNETTTSTVYYTDFSTKNVTISGFEAGTTGKQTILVNDGAASYDIYVLNTNSAYQDADENYVVTVDKSYTGEIGAVSGTNGNMFKTVGQALEFLQNTAFVPASANKILNIGAGYYKEKLEITTPNLTINGAGATRATYEDDVNYNAASYAASTIIEFDTLYGEYAPGLTDVNQQHTTDSTQTVAVRDTATNCKISGVTISNYYNNITRYEGTSHEGNGERGLALLCQADQFQMVECSLLGWQDTVEFFTGRQYIVDSYVCGAVDFIFGTNSTTYFNGCIIESIASKSNSQDGNVVAYVTAFKGINKDSTDAKTYGAIFNECVFTNSSDFVGKYAIARPWTAYSNVAVVNSTIAGNAATTETTTIATGLITDVNVSTLNIKFYGNKDGNDNAFTLTDDLTNVNTTLTSDANYATYTAAFSTSNGYAVSWDPEAQPIIEKDIIFNETGNYLDSSLLDLTEFNSVQVKEDTVGFSGKIKVSVKANSIVEINAYSDGYTHFTVNGYNVVANSSFYYATAGTLVIDSGSTTSYMNSIKVYENVSAPETATLKSIVVSGQPISEFVVGEECDLSNLTVKAIYTDGKYQMVTDFTTDVATSVNTAHAGDYTVTVTYNDGTTTKTSSFTVTYVAAINNVISEDTMSSFKGGNYSSYGATIFEGTFNSTSEDVTINKITYSKIASNGQASNWITITNGASITLEVSGACALYVAYYDSTSLSRATVKLNGTTISNYRMFNISSKAEISELRSGQGDFARYKITEAGTITITFSGSGYLGAVGVLFNDGVADVVQDTYIEESTTITFGDNSNINSVAGVTNNATLRENGNNSQFSAGTITLKVKSGATVTVYGYGGSKGTNQGNLTAYTVTANGATSETQSGDYSVTATADGEVVITSANENNYLMSINISYPVVISTATNLLFGSTDKNYNNNSAFKITATVQDHNDNDSWVYDGNIEFTVAAGARVEVYANYSCDYVINGASVVCADGTAGQEFYDFAEQTDIVIECDTDKTYDNYFYWIKITFPNS